MGKEEHNVYVECGPQASHTHFDMVIIWGFISEWTLDCSSKNLPARRPVVFYVKGVALLDILRFEVFKQPDPLRTKDLEIKLSYMSMQINLEWKMQCNLRTDKAN